MNKQILHKEVQDHIDINLNTDLATFIFKGSPFADVTIQELAAQVEAKKKAQKDAEPRWVELKLYSDNYFFRLTTIKSFG